MVDRGIILQLLWQAGSKARILDQLMALRRCAGQRSGRAKKGYVMASRIFDIASRFIKYETGASMVEYGIALFVVIAVGTAALTLLGGGVAGQISITCAALGLVC
jgi:Flp pilus assembly pilin Flp